jgi:hypothetical protein
MAETFVRVRIPKEVFKRFKVHCIEMNVSIPKQMTELVRKFVEIQDQNKSLIGR